MVGGQRRIKFLDTTGFLILLALWWIFSLILSPIRLPGPVLVFKSFIFSITKIPELAYLGQKQGYGIHIIYSTVRTIIGASVGVALGVVFGLLMARRRVFLNLFRLPL